MVRQAAEVVLHGARYGRWVSEALVATLNLFNDPGGRWDERAPLVASQLAALAPDVIAFQEVSDAAQVEALAAALPGSRAVTVPHPTIKSLSVLSTMPIVGAATLTGLGKGDQALRVRFAEFDLVTTHLWYAPSREGSTIRGTQVARILEWLERDGDGRPQLLVGDCNSRPEGSTVALIEQRFRSARRVVYGHEDPPTHPTELVYSLDARAVFGVDELPRREGSTLDYIFVDGSVEVLDAGLAFDRPHDDDPSLYPSDHIGVWARVRFP